MSWYSAASARDLEGVDAHAVRRMDVAREWWMSLGRRKVDVAGGWMDV